MDKNTINRGLPAQKKRQSEFLKNKSAKMRKTDERAKVPALKGPRQTAQKQTIRSR